MLVRITETKELKQLIYEIDNMNCASEVVGSFGWDGFTPESGVLACSKDTYDVWHSYFDKLSKVDKKIEIIRDERGFIKDFEEQLLSKLDEVEFFDYPDEVQSLIEMVEKGLIQPN